MATFDELHQWMFSECFDKVFLTLTTDNGSEFSKLSEFEAVSKLLVYYAPPYCSSDKGTNEKHNGLFRRFIPKGKRIQDYPLEHIAKVERWANTLPRKILGYKTPKECFAEEIAVSLVA